MSLEYGKIYKDAQGPFMPEFYVYNVAFTGITGAAPSAVQTIQTQSDADFVLQRMNYWFIDAAAGTETVTQANQELPDLTLQVTDSATSKNFFFAPMPINAIASYNAIFPNDLPVWRTVKKGASLTFAIASTKTFANSNNLTIALIGFKKLRVSGVA